MPKKRVRRAKSKTRAPHDTHNHLEGLPAELIENIAQCLDSSEDLFNFRLTSRYLGNGTTRHMARLFFQELHVLMLDAHSMFRLLQISQHPIYKHSVKLIKFNIAFLKENPCKRRGLRSQAQDTAVRQQTIRDGNDAFKGMVEKCLFAVFGSFYLAGNTPEISTNTYGLYPSKDSPGPDLQSPWGTQRLLRELGGRPLTWNYWGSDQDAYDKLCRAMSAAPMRTERLTLGHRHYPFDPYTLIEPAISSDWAEPFQNLKHLQLFLPEYNVSPLYRRSQEDVDDRGNAMLWLVSQAEQLESLHLQCSNSYVTEYRRSSSEVFFRMLATETWADFPKPLSKIKDLALWGHEVPKQMLLNFIEDHKATLRSLNLWEIIDGQRDDPGIKRDIFRAARGIKGFKLKIGRVYQGTRQARYSNHEGWALPEWETVDSVQDWACW